MRMYEYLTQAIRVTGAVGSDRLRARTVVAALMRPGHGFHQTGTPDMPSSCNGPTFHQAVDLAQLGRAADLLMARGHAELGMALVEAIFVLSEPPAADARAGDTNGGGAAISRG